MEKTVEGVLAAAFPGRRVAATSTAMGSDRLGSETVRVRFADDTVVYLKVAVDDGAWVRERLARDAAATRYARRHADVRVPDVLAVDVTGTPAYVATAALSGTAIETDWPVDSTVARATVLRAVGRALAGVHAADGFDRHARIRGWSDADDGFDLASGPWSSVLEQTLRARAGERFPDRFRDCVADVLAAIDDASDVLDAAPATLVHDDPRPENCLVDSAGPGLVDWETAMVGDPALDVVRAEAQYVERTDVDGADDDRLRRALRAGYRDHAGRLPDGFSDRYPLYRAVSVLEAARTFDRWAPDAPEPLAELASWVRGELAVRLDALDG
ncbi:aminoglycoside phosphotransferase family protein [Halorubellus sp. PRR65]|uniref:phosphotransferase family protein n=1 Tax=Halorubellus sp. PRR65 TaxID=3098148 RepID=UPI002B261C34|nr:aminoglycoside phosphotransferase family protein [Halorubellus sp. PRR65]